ncbi:hypothetical protein BDFG_06363 [Blastomyces dermatitidis ATCC 26199]|nr:hypothetical protein BDFG_06363 [Blastomyces dermatitidis ATCC 26199]
MITWQPGPSGLVKNSSKEPNELELRNLLVGEADVRASTGFSRESFRACKFKASSKLDSSKIASTSPRFSAHYLHSSLDEKIWTRTDTLQRKRMSTEVGKKSNYVTNLGNCFLARVTDEILGMLALKGGPPRESGGSIAQPPSHTHLFMEF